jgi:hypothetical protein
MITRGAVPHARSQLCVVLPIAHVSRLSPEGRGLAEDSLDTLHMVGSSRLLQVLLLVYTGSLQAYNMCGMVAAGACVCVCVAFVPVPCWR